MKKLIISIGMLFSTIAFSQSYVGYLNDNYSGVHAVINNPANIVDSRFRTDINLFGTSAFFSNDIYGIAMPEMLDNLKKKGKLDDINKKEYFSDSNNAILNLDILGPSFMFNINPKHSLAISTRLRSFVNVNDVDGQYFKATSDGIENLEKITKATLGKTNLAVNVWSEIGLSYATILLDKKEHFLKGGLSLKYIKGAASANFVSDNITVEFNKGADLATDIDDLVSTTGKGTFSNSKLFNEIVENENYDNILNSESTGFGGDFGFTYEWRPDIDKYSYKTKDGTKAYYRDANKYKLRIGFSVTDIGSINYEGSEETYNLNGVTINKIKKDALPNSANISETLKHYFNVPVSTNNELKTSLPTAIHFNTDWNINDKFYLNLDTNFGLSNDGAASIENTYSLTPRFEMKYFSASVPLSLNEFSGFNAGFGLRAGPLYVGSGSVLTNLMGKESKSLDFYFGIKIPVFQSRPKDKDADGIFDNEDKCPEVPGPKENDGCPWGDKDGDTITDNLDKCTDVAGPKENDGCPWGDKDSDGVLDNVDKCPDVTGLAEYEGCADTDGDTVPDNEDKCPEIKGAVDNNGCPKDSDGDGVLDADDRCPTVAGVKEEQGCPEKVVVIITEAKKKELGKYAKAIYFNSGKNTFKPGVTEKLDMIAEIMQEFKDVKFSIEGHTDSAGGNQTNQKLSEKRALAVLKYLVKNGIDQSKLAHIGMGEDYPIDSNKTKSGRATNRRVEIKAVK